MGRQRLQHGCLLLLQLHVNCFELGRESTLPAAKAQPPSVGVALLQGAEHGGNKAMDLSLLMLLQAVVPRESCL